jgi:uncharacterized protein
MEEFEQIRTYLKHKPVSKAAIFGSFSRGEQHQQSDIDLLIEAHGMTLFDILKMEQDLEKITRRKIDIVEYKAVKPLLQTYVFSNLIEII